MPGKATSFPEKDFAVANKQQTRPIICWLSKFLMMKMLVDPCGPPESVPSGRLCSLSLRYRLFALQEGLQTEPFLKFMTGCLEVKIDLWAVL